VGSRRLPGALAERLLLTGDELGAQDAQRAGLVTALVTSEDPHAAVVEWYRKTLAGLSAFSLREATLAGRRGSGLVEALRTELPGVERQYLDRLVASHDGNEGIEAFLGRRAPQWEDA
jgi:enoyl-CoA hydratase/carnithine racemase